MQRNIFISTKKTSSRESCDYQIIIIKNKKEIFSLTVMDENIKKKINNNKRATNLLKVNH